MGADPLRPSLDCPVCPRLGLPADTLVCPGCGADLGPLQRLRALPDALATLPAEPGARAAGLAAAVVLAPARADLRVSLAQALRERGRVEEARTELRAALAQAPGDAAAAEALAALPDPAASTAGPGFDWRAALILGLLAGALVGFGVSARRGGAPVAEPSPSTPSTAVAVAPSPTPAVLSPLAARLDQLAGTEVAAERGELVVSLDLRFAPGDDAVPAAARTALRELGEALAAESVEVAVVGHTDRRPMRRGARFLDNWSLGLARAAAVGAALRAGPGAGQMALLTTARAGSGTADDTRTASIRVRPLRP